MNHANVKVASRILSLVIIVSVAALAMPARAQTAQTPLVNFAQAIEAKKLTATDAKTTLLADGQVLRVATGHGKSWPGVSIAAPQGHWDLSASEYIAIDVANRGKEEIKLRCRVDNPGADGTHHCINADIALAPGESGTLKIPLNRESKIRGKLFGMRGYPTAGHGAVIDPANITQLVFFIGHPTADHTWEISNIRRGGEYHEIAPDKFFPFIDSFGQYIHRDWPGKVHSSEELIQRREQEAKELQQDAGPATWDKYGGWQPGPTLQATGFFRVEKYQGKWWLVDPDGKLFFSHGIDSVRSGDATPVDERQTWFADFPGDKAEFKDCLSWNWCLKGYYAEKTPKCFSFARANLKRKYGAEWKTQTAEVIQLRLRHWGLNTIGNWSDRATYELRKTAYVVPLGFQRRKIQGSEGYWGKFGDPFDPDMPANAQRAMKKEMGHSIGDPWCLGYFVDNEIGWGSDTSLAVAALASPADQPAKLAFIADLKAAYGQIEKLNAAWGTHHESWDALLQSRAAPDVNKAGADLRTFYVHLAEQYFRSIRDAIKQAAPKQLYLGCRFAWVNKSAASAAAKYCDVVSYNRYQKSVDNFKMPGGEDVPLIIGEFHFGALDRGMFHTGLAPVENQAARAKAYQDYVRSALRNPQVVGCHWFEYQDEPTTGRNHDEENYQIGFVDIADTPYVETITACRELADRLYQERMAP